MGVRTIGYRFTGDYRDLDAALSHIETRIKSSVSATERATTSAGQASVKASTTAKAAADSAVEATARVIDAEAAVTEAIAAHVAAQEAAAEAAVKAGEAQVAAAEAAATAAASAGSETGAEDAVVAAAEASAAARAEAELTVAEAAEESAAKQVEVAEAAAEKQVAAKEKAIENIQRAEAAAYREDEARTRRMASLEEQAYAEDERRTRTAEREEEAASERRARRQTQIGQGLIAAGLATGAGIGIAVKAFADFDVAMSAAAAGTNATVGQLEDLKAAAIDAGASTQYSATEAAEAITALGKAGVSTNDILSGGLQGSLDLAAAGQLGVGEAAEIAATAMTQFSLAGKDLPHVADLLAAGAGKAQGEVTDLANALKYVGPVAAGLNVSIEQTTGVLAEFASQGIIGEQAGTSLRGVLLSLTSPSKAAAAEMKKLGIELYDNQGKFVGLDGVAGQLQASLSDVDDASRDAALGVLFGNEQVTAARILYQGGAAAVNDWTNKVNDSGFAARQAAKLTDNLRGDLERLGGAFSSVFITSGEGADGPLRNMVQILTDIINVFGKLPTGLQQGIILFGGLSAALLVTGGACLVLIPKIAATRVALVEMGITAQVVSGKMALLGKAAAVLAVYFTAMQALGAVIDKTADKAVGVDKIREAFAKMGKGETATGLNTLGNDFEYLGTKLEQLTNPSVQDRIGDFTGSVINMASFGATNSSGGSEGRRALLGDLSSLDTYLAQLVNSGHADEAAKQFELINKKAIEGGAGVNQLEQHLPQFTDAADQAALAAGVTGEQIDAMGGAAATAAIKATALKTQIEEVVEAAKDATESAFLNATDVLGNFDPTAKAKAEDRSKDATDRLADAKQNLRDVEKRISDGRGKDAVSDRQREQREEQAAARAAGRKKGATQADKDAADRAKTAADKAAATRRASDSADEVALRKAREAVKDAQKDAGEAAKEVGNSTLAATYKNTIQQATQFTKDISAALSKGLDPTYVQELLQQGPEKAGPILRELVSDHSGKLIKLVNDSEEKLAELNQLAVEQARLTSLAIASGTDEMTTNLADAVAIATEKAGQGADATQESIAKKLKIPPAKVAEIAKQFGIGLLTEAQAEIQKHNLEVNAEGTVHISVKGRPAAIEAALAVRAALNELGTKTATIKVDGKEIAIKNAEDVQAALKNTKDKTAVLVIDGTEIAIDDVEGVRDALENTKDKDVKVKVNGKETSVEVAEAIQAALKKLRDKTVTVTVHTRNTQEDVYGTGGGHYEGGTFVPDKPKRSADGGKIDPRLGGPRQDNVPLLVSGGEWVHNARASAYYGDDFMRAVNEMRLPRFADGGPVSGTAYASTSSTAQTANHPKGSITQPPAPTVVRVPVHESHTRTIQVGDVVIPGANPHEYEQWAAEQHRRAERSFS